MSPATLVAWFIAIALMVMGLSHALHPRLWGEHLRGILQGPHAAIVIGLPTFLIGLFVILAHPLWPRRPEALVTLLGWLWVIKGGLYQLLPHLPKRWSARHLERSHRLRWIGGVMASMGLAVAVDLVMRA